MAARTGLEQQPMTTGLVEGVSFQFFSEEKLKKLSVKAITNPVIFDNLNNPVPGGLYDLALGPWENDQQCGTCALKFLACPGHFGHIDLAVPVYHPLIFNVLVKILRASCLHCFDFRMQKARVQRLEEQLQLLAEGQLVEARQLAGVALPLEELAAGASRKGLRKELDELRGELLDEDEGPEVHVAGGKHGPAHANGVAAGEDVGSGGVGGARAQASALVEEAVCEIRNAFFSSQPSVKCHNCNANSPKIKAMENSKVFMLPLKPKQALANESRGIAIASLLPQVGDTAEAVVAELEGAAQAQLQRQAAKRKHADEDDGKGDDAGDWEAGKDGGRDDMLGEAEAEGAFKPDAKRAKGGKGVRRRKGGEESEEEDDDGVGAGAPQFLTPSQVQEMLRRVWSKNWRLLSYLYATGPRAASRDGWRSFFVTTLPVAPNMYRRPSRVRELLYEHPQNTLLKKALDADLDLRGQMELPLPPRVLGGRDSATLTAEEATAYRLTRALGAWLSLQDAVNNLMDSTKARQKRDALQGIKQGLEKKEGIFRMNMMGKRVNFAARSVISPDPYIGTDEIGIPAGFAMTLSFPERVTSWNVDFLRSLVVNGAHTWPGAVAVQDLAGRIIHLDKLPMQKREAVAKQLLSLNSAGAGGPRGVRRRPKGTEMQGVGSGRVVVHRHVLNGDLLLTNRQPTLHKPGLMAHSARVFHTGERTIRLHYANCSTFNADFDGDEINLHMPQDQLCRAEGYGIVHADHQYIVPTAGAPIRGLIQDHIIASVLLTCRDTFLPRHMYCQLVYTAVTQYSPAGSATLAEQPVQLLPPALVKPRALWTGKQVITTLLAHLTRGLPPLTVRCKGKVPKDYWGQSSGEAELQLYRGTLVAGVFDKAQYGKFGLVHAFHELYGGKATDRLLNAFSRLFTFYLQVTGFTCGMDDLLLTGQAEQSRAGLLGGAGRAATAAAAKYVGLPEQESLLKGHNKENDARVLNASEAVRAEVGRRWRTLKDGGAGYDMTCTGALHPIASEVVKSCLPRGQVKRFPGNCMSLMTTTGAKGSVVNFSQISCLLGQQELEGRRVPRLPNGKTLPCFAPYDAAARADGFITDRFLSGLRPQEYYFHCMAGREGLVDTTVKTARSGYLQRCIIKNLEALRSHYDATVRNDTDGSIVQFQYGEDGVDVLNTGYLQRFDFCAANMERLAQRVAMSDAEAGAQRAGVQDMEAEALAAARERQQLIQERLALSKEASTSAAAAAATAPPDAKAKAAKRAKRLRSKLAALPDPDAQLPLAARLPATLLGVTSEAYADALGRYCADNPDGLLERPGGGGSGGSHLSAAAFTSLMQGRFLQSLVAPGEAVGVLAGQSIGEPSTQMTLNTFHMAGRGEANVTLGIPRLRELFMTASRAIKTPVMTLPLLPDQPPAAAKVLTRRLRCVRFGEALRALRVVEAVSDAPVVGVGVGRRYTIELVFYGRDEYPDDVAIAWDEVAAAVEGSFKPRLKATIQRMLRRAGVRAVQFGASDMLPSGERAGVGADEGGEGAASDRAADKKAREGEDEVAAAMSDEEDDDASDLDMDDAKQAGRTSKAAEAYDAADADEALTSAATSDEEEEEEGEDTESLAVSPADAADAEAEAGSPPQRGKAKAKAKDKGKGATTFATRASLDERSCTATVEVTVPLGAPQLLMLEVAEKVAYECTIRAVPGIDKCYVVQAGPASDTPTVQTDGINFLGAWESDDIVDVDKIVCNDVGAVLAAYGVEAARATLVREVASVFKAYGIGVDARHLGLIADHMTQQGGYRPCNRIGMQLNTSPILKMSFETASAFLTDASIRGSTDSMTSPASRIAVGRPVQVGTGCIDIIQQV